MFLCFQSVIVKSIERNAPNMYEARRRLLGVTSSGEVPPVSTSPNQEADAIRNRTSSLGLGSLAGLLGHNLLNVNTMMVNGHRSPLTSPHSPTSATSSPLITSSPGKCAYKTEALT